MAILAVDTETTGLDLRHGARPFFLTTCDEEGKQRFWEWDVDPLTRAVTVPEEDARDIRQLLAWQDRLILQNAKFDAAMLLAGDISDWKPLWELTHDTLIAGHLLASNMPHDLTSMAMQYLGIDIQPLEDALESAVNECRRQIQQARLREKRGKGSDEIAAWRIAEEGLADMPSASGKCWKNDTWLPRCLARYWLDNDFGAEDDEKVQGWLTVTQEYANADSAVTLKLWQAMEAEIHKRGLWEIYLERMRLLPSVAAIEHRGVTISKARTKQQCIIHERLCQEHELNCIRLSKGSLPCLRGTGSRAGLTKTVFGTFGLKSSRTTAKGNDSMDKNQIDDWLSFLPPEEPAYQFLASLKTYRKQATALDYAKSYIKFWLPVTTGWARLHPSLNPTATDTLRFSSNNPNSQQVGKQELAESGGHSSRYMFGPAPGREWWPMDYENIELRIPAYRSGEQELIELFEHPDDPPYFGSKHLLIFDVLHPDKFKQHGAKVKDVFKSTWYQWVKNGNFAVQYGAVERSGTADRAYHLPGAQRRIASRFTEQERLNQQCIQFADKYGYVETIPDKTVNPKRGYPLLCTRTNYGRVLPTVPLNYMVQGTAMWCTMKAMIRCHAQLEEWNKGTEDGKGWYMVLQVHDEIIFDFPKGNAGNYKKALRLKHLMEMSGDDIGIPLKVAITYCPVTWAKGEPHPYTKETPNAESYTKSNTKG